MVESGAGLGAEGVELVETGAGLGAEGIEPVETLVQLAVGLVDLIEPAPGLYGELVDHLVERLGLVLEPGHPESKVGVGHDEQVTPAHGDTPVGIHGLWTAVGVRSEQTI